MADLPWRYANFSVGQGYFGKEITYSLQMDQ